MNKSGMILLALGMPLLLVGCGPKKPVAMKVMPLPTTPAPGPAARPDPIDVALRETAKREIRTNFASTDPRRRANAIEAAQNGLGASDETRNLVAAGLNDKEAIVRFAAAMSAGTLKFTDVRPDLSAMASDPNTNVQIAVRYALHRMGDTRLTHDLEKTAVDPRPLVRANTAMAMGFLGEKSAIKVLKQMAVGERDGMVRIQIAEARWRLGDEEALEILVAGLVSAAPDDQGDCIKALVAPKDKKVEDYVRGKLTNLYVPVTLIAARAMGELGYDIGYGVAIKNVSSTDPLERSLAATALGYIGRSDAQRALATLLRDSDARVRLAAAQGVLQLKAPTGMAGAQANPQ